MNSIFAIIKKYSVILAILIMIAGVVGGMYFVRHVLITVNAEKEDVSTLLSEGGAFAASHVSIPDDVFKKHDDKQVGMETINVIDIFERQQQEATSGGYVEVVVEEELTEDGEVIVTEEGGNDDIATEEIIE